MTPQEQWQQFISTYEDGMSTVEQQSSAVINDSTSTDTQKSSAAQDYAKQQMFLTRIKEMYASGDYDNPTNTFSVNGASSIYLSAKDAKYHVCALQPWSDAGQIALGAELTHDILLSDEFAVTSHMENTSPWALACRSQEVCDTYSGSGGPYQRVGCKFVATPDASWHCWFTATGDYFTPLADVTDIFTRDNSGYYMCLYAKTQLRLNQNTIAFNTFSSKAVWTGYGIFLETCFAAIIDIDSDEMENPWDYYNDNILPTISDPSRAAIPGGYSPDPVRPDPEDPGEEETGGDDYDPNDPSSLGGGFGFTTQYALRASHLTEIGQILWKGFANLQNYIDNFVYRVDPTTGSMNMEDIMQYFISLRAYPCPISALASTSAGGYDLYIGSGAVPLTLTTPISIVNSFIGYINAGDLTLPYWFGDFRDYDLNVTVNLPYCGTAELNPGDVMGGTLHCFYYVDLCTGACTGYVTCDTWEGSTILVASIPGQLGADVPLTATNSGRVMSRMYGDRINAVSNIVDAAKAAVTGIGAIMSGNPAGAIRQGFAAFIDPAINEQKMLSEQAGRAAIAAPVLSSGKGFASFGTSKTAYVQVRSPIYAAPENYAESVGVPSSSAVRIGDCSGFCQFVNVDVSGITTDAADQAAIRQALAAGIII